MLYDFEAVAIFDELFFQTVYALGTDSSSNSGFSIFVDSEDQCWKILFIELNNFTRMTQNYSKYHCNWHIFSWFLSMIAIELLVRNDSVSFTDTKKTFWYINKF